MLEAVSMLNAIAFFLNDKIESMIISIVCALFLFVKIPSKENMNKLMDNF